jgi:hypothetical protein
MGISKENLSFSARFSGLFGSSVARNVLVVGQPKKGKDP